MQYRICIPLPHQNQGPRYAAMVSLRLTFALLNNTFVRLPVTLRGKRLNLGQDAVLAADASMWKHEVYGGLDQYTELDSAVTRLLGEVELRAEADSMILDICCNVGRHLAYLHRRGFTNAVGFDVMPNAVAAACSVFPESPAGNIQLARADIYLDALPDDSVDIAYTHTATVELIHPSYRLAQVLYRVVKPEGHCIFLLNERGHTYPRLWRYQFKRAGFREVSIETIKSPKGYEVSLITWQKI